MTIIIDGQSAEVPAGGGISMDQVNEAIQNAINAVLPGSNVPPGGVIIWTGEASAVPEGWALCDGTNGTPDLRGRFVLGESESHAAGTTGGTETVRLSTAQLAKHSHGQYVPVSATGSTTSGYVNLVNPASTNNPVSGRPYEDGLFGGTTNANQVNTKTQGDSEPHENMPPYYVLAYIMKL